MPLTAFVNTFAGNPLDRASDRRGDAAWVAAQLAAPDTLVLPLWNGQPLAEDAPGGGVRLGYVPGGMAREIAGDAEPLLFMGLWKETAVFALDMESAADPASGPFAGFGRFEELRPLAAQLTPAEAAIAAGARATFEWRRRHRFCSNCGQPSHVAEAGWKRICPACGAEHFPRTDPVVIMLPVRGEMCLLGRQPRFPPGMHSALAGFLEPGESIEEACARELKEEAALQALSVRYHSSQPWPYPGSLMIGLIAEMDEGEARPDQTELESVRWFSRAEAGRMAAGESVDGCFCPPPLAIAHQLVKAWAAD